nr:TonB-dependent receptor [Chitinophagaceae bacterium]
MKQLLLTLSILFICNILFAQIKISGIVKDPKGNPLNGANITLEGTYDGATSKLDGKFSFSTSEKNEQKIIASVMGYSPITKPILIGSEDIEMELILKEKINSIKAVKITAGAFEASDEKKGTVLNSLDIVTTAGSNGDSYGALKTLPGTQQINDREGLFVRGGLGNETQTFIDGTLVRNAFNTAVPDLGSRGRFNPFIFKGTVFSAGGYSALYGQAMSSAVILETIDMPDRSSANLNFSSVGIGASFQKLSKNKKQSFGLGYNYVNLLPYFLLIKQNVNFETPPSSHQIDVNYRIKTSKTGLLKFYGYLNTFSVGLERQNVTSLDYANVEKKYIDNYLLKNKNFYGNLAYREFLNKDWQLKAGLSLSKNQDDINSKILNQSHQEISDSNFINQENFSANNANFFVTSKIVFERSLKNMNEIRFGAEYIFMNDDNSFITKYASGTKSLQQNYMALFAESDIYISNDLAAKVGLRSEYNNVIKKTNLAPRLSLAYKLSGKSQVSAAYGMFYQNADVTYLNLKTNLKFQRADHYIINYQYQNDGRLLRLEGFKKDYFSLITSQFNKIENNGNGFANGIELFYRDRKTIKGFDYWISYSYINSKRLFLNYPTLVQPDFVSNHVASFVFKKFWVEKKFGINGTYTFSSARPYNDKNSSQFMQGRTIPFHNISFSANYLTNIGKAFTVVVLSVTNPFGFKQVYGYNFAQKDLNLDTKYYQNEILPTARQFIFIGAFFSWGIDRSQEAIDNNL